MFHKYQILRPSKILFCLVIIYRYRVRCYDHNYLRFSPIFGEKIDVFLKKTVFLQNLAEIGAMDREIESRQSTYVEGLFSNQKNLFG
jgi:hypothetical protein